MIVRRRTSAIADQMAGALALVLGLGLGLGSACYAPKIGDGTLSCAPKPNQQCPRGFKCRADNLCWRTDADASIDGSIDGLNDRPNDGPNDGPSDPDRFGEDLPQDLTNDGQPDQTGGEEHPGDSIEPPDQSDSGDRSSDDARAVDSPPPFDGGPTDTTIAPDIASDRQTDVCDGSGCGKLPDGTKCTQSAACESGKCVDGYCCNELCQGQCMACDQMPSAGKCIMIADHPHGNRGACRGSGQCAGSCQGASSQCVFPLGDIACGSPVCAGTTLTPAGTCNGDGVCSLPAASSCGAFRCNGAGNGCLTSCASDNDCAPATPYCVQSSCVTRRPNGQRCSVDGECDSNHCVDRMCCDSACQEPCQACDVTDHAGACTPLPSGNPRENHPKCGGDGECAGFCGGALSGACTFPGTATKCMCPAALLGLGACNGSGACHLVGLDGVLGGLCI